MSGRLITVYEDRTTRLDLNDKEKQAIIALKELWGSQNLILQADGSLLLKHYVGFVYHKGTRLQILLKVFADGPAETSASGGNISLKIIQLDSIDAEPAECWIELMALLN